MSTINYEHKLGCWVKMPFGETGLAGAAGQLVHRLKQVQINNHGRAFSTFITNYSSANCIYLKEQFFLGVEDISKHRFILLVDLPHLCEQGIVCLVVTPSKAGEFGMMQNVWVQSFSFGGKILVVLGGAARQPSKAQCFPGYFHRMSHSCTQKKASMHLRSDLSSVIWASVRNNSREANGVPLI